MKILFSFCFLFFLGGISGQWTWTQKLQTVTPRIRWGSVTIFNPTSNSLILHGGRDTPTLFNDIWQYNISSNIWTQLNPVTIPPGRCYFAGVFSPPSNSFVIFGGTNLGNSPIFNDLWRYNISNNSWIQLNPTSPPPVRYSPSAVYLSSSNSMLVFGGFNGAYLNDLWRYDISNNSWIQLNPTSTPPARVAHSATYVDSSNSMFIFGGGISTGYLNDLWMYYISNNSWIQLNPTSTPPAVRSLHTANFIASSNSILIYGGCRPATSVGFNETYLYNLSNNSWSLLNYPLSPGSRCAHSAVSLSTTSLAIFGGYSFTPTIGGFNDTWIYSIPITTTEQITTGIQTTGIQTTGQLTTGIQVQTTDNSPQVTTVQQQSQQSSKTGNSLIVGVIIGVVVGVLVIALLILLVVILVLRKRKSNKTSNQNEMVDIEKRKSAGQEMDKSKSTDKKNGEKEDVGQKRKTYQEIVEFKLTGNKIGAGSFGEIYEGMIGNFKVACKRPKDGTLDFEREVRALEVLDHKNIVKFLGLKEYNGIKFLVMEYMNGGSLLKHVRDEKVILGEYDFLDYARQIASGMEYLESEKVIHLDLALRNVLWSQEINQIIVKISDFGLSQFIAQDKSHFTKKEDAPFAIRWAPPESIGTAKFTMKYDVWSFGVVLFELYSKGEVPWTGMKENDVERHLAEHKPMPVDEKKFQSPPFIRDLMNRCMKISPDDRPSFKQIVQFLENPPIIRSKVVENPPINPEQEVNYQNEGMDLEEESKSKQEVVVYS